MAKRQRKSIKHRNKVALDMILTYRSTQVPDKRKKESKEACRLYKDDD